MNEKRKNKSINYEKVRFQFCSKGVERESGITQVHREQVPYGRRGVVEPSWTLFWFVGRTVIRNSYDVIPIVTLSMRTGLLSMKVMPYPDFSWRRITVYF